MMTPGITDTDTGIRVTCAGFNTTEYPGSIDIEVVLRIQYVPQSPQYQTMHFKGGTERRGTAVVHFEVEPEQKQMARIEASCENLGDAQEEDKAVTDP